MVFRHPSLQADHAARVCLRFQHDEAMAQLLSPAGKSLKCHTHTVLPVPRVTGGPTAFWGRWGRVLTMRVRRGGVCTDSHRRLATNQNRWPLVWFCDSFERYFFPPESLSCKNKAIFSRQLPVCESTAAYLPATQDLPQRINSRDGIQKTHLLSHITQYHCSI